ncbi:uncharacterized protein LOC114581320 [Dendrobium catenatum]|uniref:uncharacterized protein LOC114581320 n=1 Tax=Dendrobium catenatum TaxID=906689 RepID=UPI0010A06DB7|nr:uncharacterized protein LOC114581320 [Dendrobium catenatum]
MVLWRKDVAEFSMIEHSSQVIVGNLTILNKGCWKVASAYASPKAIIKKGLWECLEKNCSVDCHMVVGGDFNCVLSQEEKRGGNKFIMSQGSLDMKKFMIHNDLHEVKSMGPKYTWYNNKSGGARILEKLDRCLINSTALNAIHLAQVKHLSRIASDHCPILLEILKPLEIYSRWIRYEDVWDSYHGVAALVKKVWNKNCGIDPVTSLNLKFKRTLRALFFWSRAKFINLNLVRDKLKEEILEIQLEEAKRGLSIEKLQLLRLKVNELNVTLARLNSWWRKRAKAK